MNRFSEIMLRILSCMKSTKGVTVVEYCIIIVVIAIAIIAALSGIGSNSNKAYSTVNSALN